jgi:hypothetical protein
MEFTYDMDGIELDVVYTYDPGEAEVWTESNGDPGTPGIAPSVEITAAYSLLKDRNNNDVMVDILPLDIVNQYDIEEEILESYE